MSDTTEIYTCKPGQGLKEGKLEYSSRIHGRGEAESDAEQRCRLDPSIDRIAYYAVDESGKFRNFFTYKNSRAAAAPKQRERAGGVARPASVSVSRPARPPTLFRRIRAVFEVD